MSVTYKIVRHYENENIPPQTIKTGLTREEAQEHCRKPETSSSTATSLQARRRTQRRGRWFDGYEQE